MAGRTSMSVGVGALITGLSLATLGLFVTTAIFVGKASSAEQKLQQVEKETDPFIKTAERNSERVRQLQQSAKEAGGNKSLVGYLVDASGDFIGRVSGNKGDTFAVASKKLDEAGAKDKSLLSVVADKQSELASLTERLKQAETERSTVLADLKAESDRRKQLEDSQKKTVAALNTEVTTVKSEVDNYRKGVQEAKAKMDENIQAAKEQARARETELTGKLSKLEEENLVLKEQIAKLRKDQSGALLKSRDEYALVDGEVIGLNPVSGEVIINRGFKNKIQLGMTFAVYGDASQIKPDPATGDYPRGKANIEVINVDDETSTCRVTSGVKGLQVIKGDVIANAIYDPNKIYKFVVYGNFDINGDGDATPAERNDVTALIAAWNAKVVEDLSGDVDFLVLGERPVLPPKPGVDAPIEVVQQYVRIEREAGKYDDLYKAAVSTGVPVLNQNRFFTLIGKTPIRPAGK